MKVDCKHFKEGKCQSKDVIWASCILSEGTHDKCGWQQPTKKATKKKAK